MVTRAESKTKKTSGGIPLHIPQGDIAAEQLLKWLALAILTAIVVIGLMKGMLGLAVYLIKTLPMSMVS
jgi:hypothetical protein